MGLAIHMDLEVQMRSCASAGVARLRDMLPFVDSISYADQDGTQMSVPGHLSVLMVDIHTKSVSTEVSCPYDNAAVRRQNIIACWRSQVNTRVESAPPVSIMGGQCIPAGQRPDVLSVAHRRRPFCCTDQDDLPALH